MRDRRTIFPTNELRGGRFAVALVMVAAFYTPQALAALDLTGTWTGTWTCKDVTSGAVTKPSGTVTIAVTQNGGDVNADVNWGSSQARFLGQVQELTAKPGQGATTLIACGTTAGSSVYGETLSANVKVSSSSATFKGVSAYEQAELLTVGGTCKYSLKRTATANPGINTCYAMRFQGNGDGTVTDHQTGLQWEKKDNTCPGIHCVNDVYTWNTTFGGTTPNGTAFTDFLGTLNNGTSSDGTATSGCFAGHCDWRLPAIEELAGIVDLGAPGCGTFTGPSCIDQTVFGPTVNNNYRSATTSSTNPNTAWYVEFSHGLVNTGSKSDFNYVRAVRSGP